VAEPPADHDAETSKSTPSTQETRPKSIELGMYHGTFLSSMLLLQLYMGSRYASKMVLGQVQSKKE
jgi:hypothetical protein